MIKRYWREAMRKLWEGSNKKFYYWFLVELAVLEAREGLNQIPAGIALRVRSKFGFMDLDENWWPKVVKAIERRDKVLEHDLNAFLDIMRMAIILSPGDFLEIIEISDDEKLFNQMIDAALAKGKDNLDAGYFHKGMTSYDTEEAAMAMLFRDSCAVIDADLALLEKILIKRAKAHRRQLMIGRTHGQHAQPITFGIKILNYLEMVRRARMNLRRVAEDYYVFKLSGAVGGYGTLGPEVEREVGKILGLRSVIATQIVPIDYRARVISEMAVVSQVLRKIANDLWLMMQTEVGELREHFTEKQKGSSAMMHKKNPIRTERARGLASLLIGYSAAMLDVIATSHERDISHSSAERIIAMDAFGILDYQINLLAEIIEKMEVFPERMLQNLEMTYGVIASQKLEMLLTEKGMGAEEAYRITQAACSEAIEKRRHLFDVIMGVNFSLSGPVSDLLGTGALGIDNLKAIFDWREWVKEEDYIYERANIDAA